MRSIGVVRCFAAVLAVEVVLAQEDHRERPDRRHVQRLVKCPDVRGAVAEEAQRHAAVAQVLRRERRPQGDRQMRAHDRERPVCADGDVREVHRAALAAAQAVRLAHDLSEGPVRWRPHCEHGAVAAVGAEHRVAVRSAPHAPTTTASCPWHRCVEPRTSPEVKRRCVASSNARISHMRRRNALAWSSDRGAMAIAVATGGGYTRAMQTIVCPASAPVKTVLAGVS